MGNIRYDIRQWYFSELSIHLREHGFATEQADGESLLSVIWKDQPLCRVNTKGIVFFDSEKVWETGAKMARDRVVDLAKMTNEYIRLMEWAPDLNAEGLDGDYRLLSEFNGTVLAGHPTEYGIEFITWDRTYDHKGVTQGNYFSEGKYLSAKRDFVVRSGLVTRDELFSQEQLAEVYRCIDETLGADYPITAEREKLLKDTMSQIEDAVPDLDALVCQSNDQEMEAEGQQRYASPRFEMGGMS